MTWQGTFQALFPWRQCQAQTRFALSCSHRLFLKMYISFLFPLPLLAILPLSLWRVSFSSQHNSPGFPALHSHPQSAAIPAHGGSHYQPQPSASPPEHCCGGSSSHGLFATLLGLPRCFLVRIWLISFLGKHGEPRNSFWQLVVCLQSVHLSHR